ncbi:MULTISPECIES: hypothetical protein [Streptomyces]|nr:MULTISPECIES: hypothetical protein [Streptomyces]MBT3077607.1 hypothetical protein [Streptomyces sp. COG21]MBT3084453.1 hypothetical protein [Streptomyces sp. COG20]MBT3085360.1 hypothetical protein [Streptomyces sp. CYG21]MBT3095920.1 hypothetical protein [Streptomyces sp. CBG30]MBT3103597.1 hypothetical protein [Streptomyces sp. COG19]
MVSRTGETPERTPGRIEREIRSFTRARHAAEAAGRSDVARLLRQATDLGLDELNALNNT